LSKSSLFLTTDGSTVLLQQSLKALKTKCDVLQYEATEKDHVIGTLTAQVKSLTLQASHLKDFVLSKWRSISRYARTNLTQPVWSMFAEQCFVRPVCSAPLELPEADAGLDQQSHSVSAVGPYGRRTVMAFSDEARESMEAHIQEVNAFLGANLKPELSPEDIAALHSQLKQSNETNAFQLQLLASLSDTITALTTGSGPSEADSETVFEVAQRAQVLDAREAALVIKQNQVERLMSRVQSDEAAMNVSGWQSPILLCVVLKVENLQASFARLMDDAFAQAFATPISPFKPTLLAPTVTVTGQQHTASVARPPSAPSEPSSVTESTSSGVSMVFSPPAKRVAKKPVVRNRRGVVVCVFPF
jgi:hypothetical protein